MQLEYLLVLLSCSALAFASAWYFGGLAAITMRAHLFAIAVFATTILFVVWDYFVIVRGHWFFNSNFISGFYITVIPVEEILFFIIIPAICIMTWETVKKVLK